MLTQNNETKTVEDSNSIACNILTACPKQNFFRRFTWMQTISIAETINIQAAVHNSHVCTLKQYSCLQLAVITTNLKKAASSISLILSEYQNGTHCTADHFGELY